jgi:nitric oxide dioxygenase
MIGRNELDRWLPATRDIDVYFLGPKPFMQAIKKHLKALGVPEAQSHYEFFGPASALD